MNRSILVVIVLFSMLLIPSVAVSGQDDNDEKYPEVFAHDPIIFDGSKFNGTLPQGINGSGTENDPFVITGHWINTTSSPGLTISNSSFHFLIHTNLFTNGFPPNYPGISVSNSSNVLIDGVYAYYCTRGVEVLNCTDIIVSRSGMFGCNDGIYVQGRRVAIENCVFKANVENGILINRSREITLNNMISDGNTAILGVTSGIHIIDSHDVGIRNSTCSLNYGYGILVEPSDDLVIMERIEISNSYIDSNNNGVVMNNVRYASVEDTIMQHNTNGLYLSDARSFSIVDCYFYKNTYGVFLSYSNDMMIYGSEFDKNENGIYLDSTNNSTIIGCLMTNGTWHAITVDTWLGLGPPSSRNSIYLNEFRDNGPIGGQVMDNGENNSWYNSFEGNTWHDHWGPDTNNDTIVDVPYEIDGLGNATDMYPKAIEKGEIIVDDPGPEDVVAEKDDELTFWIIFGITALVISALFLLVMVQKRCS